MKALAVITAATVALGAPLVGAVTVSDTHVLAIEGRANATPSVAAAGSDVVIAWSAAMPEGGTDIYIASSRDAGRTFGAPIRVNDTPGAASVSGEQAPRVALVPRLGRGPSVVVVWTEKSPSGTRIVTARSDDAGKSFSGSRALSGVDAPGNRGWESIVTARDGHVAVIWLDHRELAVTGSAGMPMSHDGHAHPPAADGAEKAQLSKLYFANADGGSARALTGGVCYCCKTGIAAGPDGSLYAVWRHVYPGNIRDIAFTSSRDDGRSFAPPIRVSEDKWALDGCPENGPALAVRGRDVHVIWPTLVKGAGTAEPGLALFYGVTRDGRSFTPRRPLPVEGVPRHPQIATASNGTLLAVWDEAIRGRRRVVLARAPAASSGVVRFTRERLGNGQLDEYPVVGATSDGAVVAWASRAGDRSVIRVQATVS